MEHRQPHEIANRLFEARMALRCTDTLDNLLLARIAELPDDDFCRLDIEYFQAGAGYAYLLHEERISLDPSLYGTDHTAVILDTFFAIRPHNRYLHDHESLEYRKQICEAVLTPGIGLPDHLDPYEVSAAAMFVEGYKLVTAYHESRATDPTLEATGA